MPKLSVDLAELSKKKLKPEMSLSSKSCRRGTLTASSCHWLPDDEADWRITQTEVTLLDFRYKKRTLI